MTLFEATLAVFLGGLISVMTSWSFWIVAWTVFIPRDAANRLAISVLVVFVLSTWLIHTNAKMSAILDIPPRPLPMTVILVTCSTLIVTGAAWLFWFVIERAKAK